MHDRNKETIKRVLDREKWKQIDVTNRTQLKLYHIQNNSHDTSKTMDIKINNSNSNKFNPAIFSDKQYFVVGAMSTLINLIDEYLQCSRLFPSSSHKILPQLIEILKIFNKETKRLILKAEARESTAKLPSIAVKHLAVASQCIELTASLIPSLRLSLASYMQPKFHSLLDGKSYIYKKYSWYSFFNIVIILVTGMEKIKKGYNSHKEQLFQKFVELIEDLIDRSFSGAEKEAGPPINTLSWDEPEVTDGESDKQHSTRKEEEVQETSSAMHFFLKKIRILHKMLSKYLPPIQLQDVFTRIISSINTKFPEIYKSVQPMTDIGKQKVCNEIRVLLKVLRSLDGLREPGNALQIHFRSRFGVAASQLL